MDFLINKNADVNQNVSQLSALYLAAQNGHVKIVNRILEEKDVKIIPTEANKSVLLEKAGTINKTEELEKLLKSKNIKGEKIPGFDALHAASFFGHIEVVKSLIAHGYNPSSGKITAAEYAKAMGHTQIETMLNEFEKLNKVIKELNHLLSKYDTYKKSSVIVVLNGALEKAQLKIVKEKESPSNVLKELLDTANDLSEHPESATIKTKAFLFLRPDSLKTDLEKIIHSASKLEKKYNL